jgi:hypothetical protein
MGWAEVLEHDSSAFLSRMSYLKIIINAKYNLQNSDKAEKYKG